MPIITERPPGVKSKEDLVEKYYQEVMSQEEDNKTSSGKSNSDSDDSLKPESVQEPATSPINKRHGLSRILAQRFGPKGAIVLRFLAYKIRRSNNIREGKKWYFDSINDIAPRFPYTPRSTLADILKELEEKKAIQTGCFNRWPKDRTTWYTMDATIMNEAEKNVIWFDADEAIKWGICGALLLNNLRWYVTDDDDEIIGFHPMVPSVLAELLPYSAKTIERTLKELKKGGAIKQREVGSSFYTLIESTSVGTSKSDMTTSKPDTTTSESDMTTSKPDDNTHYKTIDKPLEKPLVNTQASPVRVCEQIKTEKADNSAFVGKGINGAAVDTLADKLAICQYTVDSLKKLNESRNEFFKEDTSNRVFNILISAANHFTTSLLVEQIIAIRDEDVNNEKLDMIQVLLAPFFSKTIKKVDDESKRELFEITLELIYESFNALKTQNWHTSISAFQGQAYNLMLPMIRTLEANRLRLRQEQLDECRRDYASVDQAKEGISNLAPAEKMRVLRNALASMNMVGWPGNHDWPVEQIIFNRGSLNTAERFFEINPEITVSDLLPIIDKCAVTMLRDIPQDRAHDPLWYAKKGVNLGFLFKHLDKITDELKVSHSFRMLPIKEKNDDK